MKIGLAQFDPLIGDFGHNVGRMGALARDARRRGCDLVVFPELAVCGYPPRDLLERQEFIEDTLGALDELVARISGITVLCGCVTRNEGPFGKPLHNSAILFRNGKILGKVHKRLLPSYDVFDESRYFEPGPASMPLVVKGMRLGVTICEDIWNDDFQPGVRRIYGVNPVAELVQQGVDAFVTISASPFTLQKQQIRFAILDGLAKKYARPFVYVNAVGGQDALVFDGASLAVGKGGAVISQAADFREDLVVADLAAGTGEHHRISSSDEERIVKALCLVLKDYTGRCGLKKVTLGLSGGIDSSVTAVLAARAMGKQNVLGVIMPSPYTSRESIEDAEVLAGNLGIDTVTLPISRIFKSYLDTLGPLFKGTEPGVAEENIQARIRGNLLMAISNKFGYMVISTGNKSELAVGYCTLYGDMSGGYALISDLPKLLVYKVARYLNSKVEIIPERVFSKPPSAELRPGQRDEDDLPPYDLLDPILELYLEENLSPDQIIAAGFGRDVVLKVVSMVERNEYKRRQAPIGPKVTSKAFGCGRRYPIAHGYRVLRPNLRQG